MKHILLLLILISTITTAQEKCEYNIVKTEDGNEIKSTKEYIMYEKVFGNTSNFIFFSLSSIEDVPILNFQLLSKSKEFSKVYCLDRASKIYLQLSNGKIVTLINLSEETCSGLVYDEIEKNNIRILTSSFLFLKGTIEDLEKYPVHLMRIKYSTETVDYTIKKELISESTNSTYFPENYFINHLKCIK